MSFNLDNYCLLLLTFAYYRLILLSIVDGVWVLIGATIATVAYYG